LTKLNYCQLVVSRRRDVCPQCYPEFITPDQTPKGLSTKKKRKAGAISS